MDIIVSAKLLPWVDSLTKKHAKVGNLLELFMPKVSNVVLWMVFPVAFSGNEILWGFKTSFLQIAVRVE